MSIDYCQECGQELPEPVYELRDNKEYEAVTYCPNCGATYTN